MIASKLIKTNNITPKRELSIIADNTHNNNEENKPRFDILTIFFWFNNLCKISAHIKTNKIFVK